MASNEPAHEPGPVLDVGHPRRTRRALLAGLAAGAGALLASVVERVPLTRGAAGSALVLGQNNYAGDSATRLHASSSGGAFWMTQNGSGSGVRGEATKGTGGIFVTKAPNHNALVAQHEAVAAGSGAALSADGGPNVGIKVTSDQAAGIYATTDYIGVFAVSANSLGIYAQGGTTGIHGDGDV